MNTESLQGALGYAFHDEQLLRQALTHPSYALRNHAQDNQRMEFLGDAVLELCVSRELYARCPQMQEGQLTRRRALLVCEATLAAAARALGVDGALRLDHGEELDGGRGKDSILADAMEAVLAAVYLDGGLDAAAALVDRMMGDYEPAQQEDRDPKSCLQEHLQAAGEPVPQYRIVDATGPAHARTFTAEVLRADGTLIGRGTGVSKKRAEQHAAQAALERLTRQE